MQRHIPAITAVGHNFGGGGDAHSRSKDYWSYKRTLLWLMPSITDGAQARQWRAEHLQHQPPSRPTHSLALLPTRDSRPGSGLGWAYDIASSLLLVLEFQLVTGIMVGCLYADIQITAKGPEKRREHMSLVAGYKLRFCGWI